MPLGRFFRSRERLEPAMGSAHASRARASGYGPLNDPLVDVEEGIHPATGPVTAHDDEALVVRAALLAAGCVQ